MSKIIARLAHYPSLAWNLAICRVFRIWNWWDQVDTLLFVGARPFKSDVHRLHELGVRAVVNTCEEFAGPIKAYSNSGIEQLHIPTIDFTSPSLEDVRTGIEFINDNHSKGHTVYIHCKAGRGRSAIIALCWLMYTHKIGPSDAFKWLKEKRKQVSGNLAQRSVVQQYWSSISET